jgi:hypothetical protein
VDYFPAQVAAVQPLQELALAQQVAELAVMVQAPILLGV